MLVNGQHYRTVWMKGSTVHMIDQLLLPFEFKIVEFKDHKETALSIKNMNVRGAGAIGATAGFGMAQAFLESVDEKYLREAKARIEATRPTAQNLFYATNRVFNAAIKADNPQKVAVAEAIAIGDEDAESCKSIGKHGLKIIEQIAERKKGETVNIMTHCNAGWLAFVDWGSAESPMYAAMEKGIPIHVYASETRPRNQGASLTAWELRENRVPHHVIPDNAAGHMMQHGMVDMVITGTDRVTRTGDVANKIGTYLKALAAKANNVPFYIALPSSTIDWKMTDGVKQIPIEERDDYEVTHIQGLDAQGKISQVQLTPHGTRAKNYGFDVTPRSLVTGLITERGVCDASEAGIMGLYPEKAVSAPSRQS